jgi:PAS domain S-box-containing protein
MWKMNEHPASEGRRSPVPGGPHPEGFEPVAGSELDALYRMMVETVRDYAIFSLDPRGHILTWNPGAERFKGWTADEIIGRHFSVFYPPEDIAAGKPDYELVVAEADGRLEDEGWRLRKDGSRFWANVTITALHDPYGTLVGFAKVTRDLTERRRSEEALRESEERFRLLVQTVQDYGIFMLDPNGRVVSWNEGAERISGYTLQEIVGKPFSVFYPEDELARGKPWKELKAARRAGRFEDEGWRLRKDGTLYWANVVITALWSSTGEPIGFTKVVRDLTERRAAQERRISDARRIAEAEASSRAKSEFLATLSHELRTPLNAIGGYVDLLSLGVRGALNPQQLEDVGRIRRNQQHLLGLINDLLNFSRIEAGALTYDLAPVPLSEVAAEVRPMIEPQAASKGLELEWDVDDPALVAYADAVKVEQILLNLLTNAVKFTPAGGRITVAGGSDGGRVTLSVTDTGIGVPPDQIQAVFEPFVQVGRSLSSGPEGTGLGLAISRDLARAMEGDLTLRSQPGAGSTFVLALPRDLPNPPNPGER